MSAFGDLLQMLLWLFYYTTPLKKAFLKGKNSIGT